ncbi:MAG: type II toxin-antitoxin system RelE/ParE family toxin [Trueperaceae bacterium]
MLLTDGAARDLDELYAAAYDRGGATRADLFLDRIQNVLTSLGATPGRGRRLPELQRLGLADGRQQLDGDLRVLYRMRTDSVLIVAIAPAERSWQALLQRRVLDS